MLNIVIDENIPFIEPYFSSFCKIKKLAGRAITPDDLKDCDALIIRSVTKVNEQLLSKAKSLKFVGTCTIGTDHVDQELLKDQNIKFFSAPGCNKDSVGEYVISTLFYLANRYNFKLKNKSLGVIGGGNTGSSVAKKAKALGMQVRVHDPFLEKKSEDIHAYTDLDRTIKSDIITFHVPLTYDEIYGTYHYIDDELLEYISDHQILINASRGDVWDNEALLKRMQKGSELRFALDVWEHEPNLIKEIIPYTQIATPHIAGYSLEGKLNGTSMIAQRLIESFDLDIKIQKPHEVLPKADVFEIAIDDNLNEDLIKKLVHLVYNVERDDWIFRNRYYDAESFDLMRKNYPVRREWSSLKVKTNKENSLVLKELGFSIDE